MPTIPIPGLKSKTGLGDAVAAVTQAVGVKPCGGCKQRQAALNRVVTFKPWSLALPAGYKLRLQGQRDKNTQILLGQRGTTWATWESASEGLSGIHEFPTEVAARADFEKRMYP